MELDVGITPDEGGQGRGGEEVGTQVPTSDTCKPWRSFGAVSALLSPLRPQASHPLLCSLVSVK